MRKAFLLLLPALAAAEKGNLLPNGSFENDVEGWVFFQLGQGDSREVEKKALRVAKGGNTPERPTMIWTDYALEPEQTGKLAFSIRAKGRKLGRTQILFILWDADGNPAVEEKVHDGDLGAKWQTFEKTIAIPSPAKGGRILVRLFEEGELWLDDASVTLPDEPPAPKTAPGGLSVANGDFERTTQGWSRVADSEELKATVEKGELRLSRRGHRLYPEMGFQQVVKFAGGRKEVTLKLKARAEGGTPSVALLAENQNGALLAFVRAEPEGDAALKLALPPAATQLRIVLSIRGPGDVWFDDVRLG